MIFTVNLLLYLVDGGMKDEFFLVDFRVVYKNHDLILQSDIDKIIDLKNQHWLYSKESHLAWMQKNLMQNDYHLWLEDNEGKMIAYMNHVALVIDIDDRPENMIGIGNVCVEINYKNKGIGGLLLKLSNYYINSLNSIGILLCKDFLQPFYNKDGWINYNGDVWLLEEKYHHLVMTTRSMVGSRIKLNRKF